MRPIGPAIGKHRALGVLLLAVGAPLATAQTCIWTQASNNPPGRVLSAAAYDSIRHRLVLFGGASNGTLADTWEWDGTAWSQFPVTGPSQRCMAQAVFDSARGRVVLYGGVSVYFSSQYLGDTWEWDGVTWMLRSAGGGPETPPLGIGLMAFDAARSRTVLHIRNTASQPETWEWDGNTWSYRTNLGPAGFPYSAEFNPADGRVFVNGTSTWAWDGASWTTLSAKSAPGKLIWDPVQSSLFAYYFGNPNSGFTLREWAGSSWVLRSTNSPEGMDILGYDTALGRVVGLSWDNTWLRNTTGTRDYLTITQITNSLQLPVGATGVFNVSVNNSPPVSYQWYQADQPLSDGGRISGSQTSQLTITNIQASDYGSFSVKVTDACASRIGLSGLVAPTSGTCFANCDASTVFPFLNVNDFNCFLSKFGAGCDQSPNCYPNCDHSTNVPYLTANDFNCFLNKYAAGCSAP